MFSTKWNAPERLTRTPLVRWTRCAHKLSLRCVEDTHKLHCTVSVIPLTWACLVTSTVPSYRKSVSPDGTNPDNPNFLEAMPCCVCRCRCSSVQVASTWISYGHGDGAQDVEHVSQHENWCHGGRPTTHHPSLLPIHRIQPPPPYPSPPPPLNPHTPLSPKLSLGRTRATERVTRTAMSKALLQLLTGGGIDVAAGRTDVGRRELRPALHLLRQHTPHTPPPSATSLNKQQLLRRRHSLRLYARIFDWHVCHRVHDGKTSLVVSGK